MRARSTAQLGSIVKSPSTAPLPPFDGGWLVASGSREAFLRYASDAAFNHYRIISYGRDGSTTGVACGTTTDFNDDIVYVDGSFIQLPEGTQQ